MNPSAPPPQAPSETRTAAARSGPSLLEREREAVLTLVSALRRAGEEPEVQGTAVNPSGAAAIGAHAAVGALATLIGQVWPLVGLLLLALAARSAWVELQGGQGAIGRLVPRRLGHNVVLWGGRPRAPADRPCLVLCAPLDGGPARAPLGTGLPAVLAAPGALSLVGLLSGPLSREVSTTLSALGGGALALAALVGLIVGWRAPWRLEAGPAGHQLLALRAALRDAPPRALDVVLAFTTGGPWRADGLEILLLNHAWRLPPAHTRVLALVPALDGAAVVPVEGRWQARPADPLLVGAAREAGLLPAQGSPPHRVTAASRASWLGYRSAALATSGTAPLKPLHEMIAALDRAATEGRW